MKVTGLILAGGKGKRMDNQDKGLIMLGNRPLVAHVINSFSAQVDSIMISANQNVGEYQKFGYTVLEDSTAGIDDFAGPLAGLLSVLKYMNSNAVHGDMLAVAPCDAPLYPDDLVYRLLETAGNTKPLAIVPHDGSQLQPLFGVYSLQVLKSLEDFLKTGQRKVGDWVESLSPLVVDFSDQPVAFLNINSPEELLDAENRMNELPI